MPLLYGEGDQAFIRLQEKIMEGSIDLSIFAWSPSSISGNSGCLASSPKDFSLAAGMEPVSFDIEPYHMTNKGLSIRLPVLAKAWEPSEYLAILDCRNRAYNSIHSKHRVGVWLRAVDQKQSLFVRTPRPYEIAREDKLERAWIRTIHITKHHSVSNQPHRYLCVKAEFQPSSTAPFPRFQSAFTFDGFNVVLPDFDHEIKISKIGGSAQVWRYAVPYRHDFNSYYVIIADLSDKDYYTASIDIQRLADDGRETHDDQIRNILRHLGRLARTQQTYVTTSASTTLIKSLVISTFIKLLAFAVLIKSSAIIAFIKVLVLTNFMESLALYTILGASIKWEQEKLVLTIEHLYNPLPGLLLPISPVNASTRALKGGLICVAFFIPEVLMILYPHSGVLDGSRKAGIASELSLSFILFYLLFVINRPANLLFW